MTLPNNEQLTARHKLGRDIMEQTFNCPNCGASLEYNGNEPSMRCPYCQNSVLIPAALRQASQEIQTTETAKKAGRYIAIFIVIIIALTIFSTLVPACLGGILGIAGPLIAIVIQAFVGH